MAIQLIEQQAVNTMLLYCSVGARSSLAARPLIAAGCTLSVANLRGGVFTWAQADRPLVDDVGDATDKVHSYSDGWARLLHEDRRVLP